MVPCDRLRAHAPWRGPHRAKAAQPGHPGGGDPLGQDAEPAYARPSGLQERQAARPRGHGHREPRHRRAGRGPRRQHGVARRDGKLRPPHRPHGARGRKRRGALFRRARGAQPAAGSATTRATAAIPAHASSARARAAATIPATAVPAAAIILADTVRAAGPISAKARAPAASRLAAEIML